jgi:hypothetical protein
MGKVTQQVALRVSCVASCGATKEGRPGRWHAVDFVRGLRKGGTYSLKEEVTEVTRLPRFWLKALIRHRRL